MRNIALIGMPGSGKTHVGGELARRLGMGFIDVDVEIVKSAGQAIPDIFRNDGEACFRRLEAEQIKKAAGAENCVIATGGGAILDPVNMECLKNCTVVFLDREPEDILSGQLPDRPLLTGDRREKLYELYNDRLSLYKKYADIEFKAEKSVAMTVDKLADKLNKYLRGADGCPDKSKEFEK